MEYSLAGKVKQENQFSRKSKTRNFDKCY